MFVGRLAINSDHPPTKKACNDMMHTIIKNQRYRLKARYFNGVRANEIRITLPVSYMTDTEWRTLVAKWSDPKNMETCEKNKQNRSKVKYHQATGSRSYVAYLHDYKQKRNREEPSLDQTDELDVVEAFKTCHTSSKHGLSKPVGEAVTEIEAMMDDLLQMGEPWSASVYVVSSVLSQNSSHRSHHFLKNVGIKIPVSNKSATPNENDLREQLAAEARAAVQGELEELKQKSEDANQRLLKTQNELEEYKKLTEQNIKEMEENRILIRQLLRIHGPSSSGPPLT